MEENDNTILSKNTKILFNFIQIRLFDLSQSLQVGGHKLSINQIKQALQKQYNIFGQIEKIFHQLKINKLYDLLKQVSQNYISIASILIDFKAKDQNRFNNYRQNDSNSPSKFQSKQTTGEKSFDQIKNSQIQLNKRKSLVQQASKSTEQINKAFENIKVYQFEFQNKLGGIHLFNENYKRGVETLEQKQQSWEQKKRKKYGQKQLILQLISKEISHQVDVEKLHDNDEISKFIREGKIKHQLYNHIDYQKDLQSISIFLKQSQDDAMKFLSQTKKVKQAHDSKDNDDEIIINYHELVEMLIQRKKTQYKVVQSKIKQIVETFKDKFEKMEHDLQLKEANIRELEFKLKKRPTQEVASQTVGLMNRFNLKNSQGAIQQLEQHHKTVVQLLKKNLDEYQKDILSLQADVRISDEKLKKKQQQVNDLSTQIQKLKKMLKQQKQILSSSRIINSKTKIVDQTQNPKDLPKGVEKVQQKKEKQLQQIKVSSHKKKKQKHSYFGHSNNNLSLASKLVKNVEPQSPTSQIGGNQNDEKLKANISSWVSSRVSSKKELFEDSVSYDIEDYIKQQQLETNNIITPNNYQQNNISQQQKQDTYSPDNQGLVKEKNDYNSQQKIIEQQKVTKRSQQIQKTNAKNSQQNNQSTKASNTNNSKNKNDSLYQNQLSEVKRQERKSNGKYEVKNNQIKTNERKSNELKKGSNNGVEKVKIGVERQMSFTKKNQESQNKAFGNNEPTTTTNTPPVNDQEKKFIQNQQRSVVNNLTPIITHKNYQKTIQKEDVTDMNNVAQSRDQRKLLQNNGIKIYQLLFKSISEVEKQINRPNQLSKFIQKYNQNELYLRLKKIFSVLKAYSNYQNEIEPIIEKENCEQEDMILSDKIPLNSQNAKSPNVNQDKLNCLKENQQRNIKRLTFRDIKINSDAEKDKKQQSMKLQKTKRIKNLTKKFTQGLFQKIHHQIRIIGKGLGVSKNQFIQICQKINLEESLPNSSDSSDYQYQKEQKNSNQTKNPSNFQRIKSYKNIKQKETKLPPQFDRDQATELKIKDIIEANRQEDKSKRLINSISGHKKKQSKSMKNLLDHNNLSQKIETQQLIKIEKLQTISNIASDSGQSEPEKINQTIKRYYNKEERKIQKKKQIQKFYNVLKDQGTKIQSLHKLQEIIEENQITLKDIIRIKALIENQKLKSASQILTKDCDYFCKKLNESAASSPKSCCNHLKKYQLFLQRLSLNQQSLRRIKKQVFSMHILIIDGNQDTPGNIDKNQLPNKKYNSKMILTKNNSDAGLKVVQTQKFYFNSKKNDEIMMNRESLKKTALSTHFESKQRKSNYFETKNRSKNADSISFLPQLGNKFSSQSIKN